MASLIQQDMLRAGVTVDTYTLDWAVFLQRLQDHDFDAAMLVFSVDWETDYSTLFHSSQIDGGMNYGAFRNAEVDQTLERLRGELDLSRRVELQHALHRLLHEQQPQTFLLSRVESSLYHRAIEGVTPGVPWFDERTWALPADRRGPDGRPAR
jgi:peptide/nickel transport system substrate-binding protein